MVGSADAGSGSGTLDTAKSASVAGNVVFKGDYNANSNSPNLDTSPSCVKKGDQYVVSVGGSAFFTESLQAGDSIIAKQDDPTTLSHWIRINSNLVTPIVATTCLSATGTKNATTFLRGDNTWGSPLARANHTGTQAASTISDFDTEVANNTAVAANTAKISYCSTASTKLGTIEGSATADQTAGEIKTAYESNACTNEFSDAEQTKLAGIEACATADQTGAQIKTAYEAEACTNEFSDAEQTKLAGIAACANNYTHSTNANLTGPITSTGNATAIAGGAIAAAKITGPLTNVVSHGLATSATTDTTCAANIGSGTLPVARLSGIGKAQITTTERLENLIMAISDETTDLETGTAKLTFRMPYGFTLTAVKASVTTAPVGSTIIVDINESGGTILSTKLSIDASEKTSTSAASAAVISDTALAADAEIKIDIDQIGSSTAGTGLKVTFVGYQT